MEVERMEVEKTEKAEKAEDIEIVVDIPFRTDQMTVCKLYKGEYLAATHLACMLGLGPSFISNNMQKMEPFLVKMDNLGKPVRYIRITKLKAAIRAMCPEWPTNKLQKAMALFQPYMPQKSVVVVSPPPRTSPPRKRTRPEDEYRKEKEEEQKEEKKEEGGEKVESRMVRITSAEEHYDNFKRNGQEYYEHLKQQVRQEMDKERTALRKDYEERCARMLQDVRTDLEKKLREEMREEIRQTLRQEELPRIESELRPFFYNMFERVIREDERLRASIPAPTTIVREVVGERQDVLEEIFRI
jgi:hypothetical protein